jgi:hypothetical protein
MTDLALAHVEKRIAAIEAELKEIRKFIQYSNNKCNAHPAKVTKPA